MEASLDITGIWIADMHVRAFEFCGWKGLSVCVYEWGKKRLAGSFN